MKALEAWVDAHIARPELNMGYRQWERMWAGERQGGQEVAQGWVERARRREERRAPRGRWKEVVEGAGLSGREEEALTLVQRESREDGSIDWASVAKEMGVVRATAQVYLERAREKVKREQRRRKQTYEGDRNGIQRERGMGMDGVPVAKGASPGPQARDGEEANAARGAHPAVLGDDGAVGAGVPGGVPHGVEGRGEAEVLVRGPGG